MDINHFGGRFDILWHLVDLRCKGREETVWHAILAICESTNSSGVESQDRLDELGEPLPARCGTRFRQLFGSAL